MIKSDNFRYTVGHGDSSTLARGSRAFVNLQIQKISYKTDHRLFPASNAFQPTAYPVFSNLKVSLSVLTERERER